MTAGIAINTLAYHGYPLDTAFAEIAALGAHLVEPIFIPHYDRTIVEELFSAENGRRVAERAHAAGLAVRALGAHMDLGLPDALPRMQRRLAFAAAAGARYLHTNTSQRARAEACIATLEALAPLADDAGVVICLENPGEPGDFAFGTAAEGIALLRCIRASNLRINYDVSNVYSHTQGGRRPEDDLPVALPLVAHAHLKDQARAARDGAWPFVAIGEGMFDFGRILASLRSADQEIPISIELPLAFERGSDYRIRLRPTGAPPLAEIRATLARSLAFIERLSATHTDQSWRK